MVRFATTKEEIVAGGEFCSCQELERLKPSIEARIRAKNLVVENAQADKPHGGYRKAD